ncbi:MAG TPA: DUF1800 domain-containing protein [Solirubrobacteraceae bacterium]
MKATGTATSKRADARARSRAAGAETSKHAEEQRKKHGKRRKHRHTRHKPKTHHRVTHAHGTVGVTVPVAPVSPPAPSPAPVPSVGSPPITLAQAQRLLWRAGFGPGPGQAESLVGQPLEEVVFGLTRPSDPPTLTGPEPVNEEGEPLEPDTAWGDDHCWWLDRMVRSNQQLVERLTLIFHDWFATSNNQVNSQPLMLEQNELLRSMALGSFDQLFLSVTTNPAMLLFLNGTSNNKWDPNENYAREMMELFSLGADRGAYTEDDVREMARTLTGWRNEWSEQRGNYDFRFDPSYHDAGKKTVFEQAGKWSYEDAVRLCVSHPLHPSFFVTKLWGYFIPTAPSEATLAALQGLYTSSSYSIRAVVEAILQHPDFYEGPEMVIPPVVYNAGLLRSISRPIDTNAWAWLSANAGQQLFYPPNVSGWDFSRWLDTSTARARWEMASYVTSKTYPNPWPSQGEPEYSATEDPTTALENALAYWAHPQLSAESEQCIATFAQSCLHEPLASWERGPCRAMRQNALRMLIATSPDMQVS